MSRDLPSVPNLEHLRKQAKRTLRELRRREPGATLSMAQLRVARDYGFASWPRLRAHVLAMQPARRNAQLAGTWTIAPAISSLLAESRFRPVRIRIDASGHSLRLQHEGLDAHGQPERWTIAMVTDGRERLKSASGWGVSARWLDMRTLQFREFGTGTSAGSRVLFRLSNNGETLTVAALGDDASTSENALPARRLVFDRAHGARVL